MSMVCLLLIFLITFVVPQFAKLYDSVGTKLPGLTLGLLAFGTGAQHYAFTCSRFAAIVYGIFRWSATEAGASRIDAVRVRMPVFGNIWLKYQVALFRQNALDPAHRRPAAGSIA